MHTQSHSDAKIRTQTYTNTNAKNTHAFLHKHKNSDKWTHKYTCTYTCQTWHVDEFACRRVNNCVDDLICRLVCICQ